MKNTLFIAPFKDKSGYARAARNYAKMLYSPELILRSVRYDSGNQETLSKELIEMHSRNVDNRVEVVIQMLTPNEMRPVKGKKNIAICCWETNRIPQNWVDALNQFDVIIVPCVANAHAFGNSGVDVSKVNVVPFVFFKEDYNVTDKFKVAATDDDTLIYYNISQWSHKKGIDALLKSYFLAFQNDENVMLVLKGYINMNNQSGDLPLMQKEVESIKNAMRLPKYPKVMIIDKTMSEKDVLKLHNSCHTYVNFSRGEGWGVPAFESLVMGNDLITVMHTGMMAYMPLNVYEVKSQLAPVFNMPHPDRNLYTSLESWFEPDVLDGVESFRKSYTSLGKINTKETSESLLTRFSPESVKAKLEELINV